MSGTADGQIVNGTPTGNPWLDTLISYGKWVNSDGSSGTTHISYATASGVDPTGLYFTGSTPAWTNLGTSGLNNALQAWANVANISFQQTSQPNADVLIWEGGPEQAEGNYGWSYMPGDMLDQQLYTVFDGTDPTWSSAGLALGGYGYITLIHELGHMLGLDHPHGGGTWDAPEHFPGVTNAFDDYGQFNLNQGIWTTMGYNDGWQTQFPDHSYNIIDFGWQATPMALDVAAIQHMYGANTTFHTGNDSYVLPSSNGAGTYWSCLWDCGGADLISNAGSKTDCTINLNAAPLTGPNAGGYVSWAANIVGGFTIANGVVIENATGGDGNDLLTGNGANNTLDGQAGNDTLIGGAGNDTLLGGAGNDTYTVTNAGDVVIESTSSLFGIDAGGIDLVKSSVSFSLGQFVEKLTLTGTAAIKGTGNNLANTLIGNAAANTLKGLIGNDILLGLAGNDILFGGLGKDKLTGGPGNDLFDFNTPGESGLLTGNRDTITDFTRGQDQIDLAGIDANTAAAGNQAFGSVTTGGPFSGNFASPGDLYFDTVNGILYGNTDSDGAAEFSIVLTGITDLVMSDLIA